MRTSPNLAKAMTKLVAIDALPMLMGNLTMGNLVRRDYEPTLAQAGDVANVPFDGEDHHFVLKHAEATFQIPDVTKVLAVPDLLQLYMGTAVMALVRRIEEELLALAPQFALLPPRSSPDATLEAAEARLEGQPKYLVTDPATYQKVRRMFCFDEYPSAQDAGLRALVDGPVGKIGAFFVFRSLHTDGAPRALAFTKDAIGLVTRKLSPGEAEIIEYSEIGNFGLYVTMTYDPATVAQWFTIGVLYGCATLHSSAAVQVIA